MIKEVKFSGHCFFRDIQICISVLLEKIREKGFGKDLEIIFVLWEHGIASVPLFLGYLNPMDKKDMINFEVFSFYNSFLNKQ